jgi:hypothetical protein
MNLRKIIERRFRSQKGGVNAAGDVSAVIATNVGEKAGRTRLSSKSRHRIVQSGGRTVVDEHEHDIR